MQAFTDKQEGSKREQRRADRETETSGRTNVETGTGRQTCKLTAKLSLTSRHALWLVDRHHNRTF